MQTPIDIQKSNNIPNNLEVSCLTTCSDFEKWWEEHGLHIDPPVLKMAFKEIAFKGWVAATVKCTPQAK